MQTPNRTSLDYNQIRKGIALAVEQSTGIKCILEEGVRPNFPRPALPYFSFKLTTPGAKNGSDSISLVSNTIYNFGGNRQMTVSFHCYGKSQEEAYNYMTLWQVSLDLPNIQSAIRKYGIAMLMQGGVQDLSMLLNTAYEGRAQMDVQFNIAVNITTDLSSIDTIQIQGETDTEKKVDETQQTVST